MELRVPAVNVVGFEHVPRNDSEWSHSEKALRRLGAADTVFVLPAAAGLYVLSRAAKRRRIEPGLLRSPSK